MNIIRKLHMLYSISEVYIMPIVLPIPFFVLIAQDILKIIPKANVDDGSFLPSFLNANNLIVFLILTLWEAFKNHASN
jgi:hypothetical protein